MRHVAVEGPIGAGKSTLARGLASRLGAELLLERPQDNPFLERFYAEPARYAMQAQLCFLFQRIEQCRALAQPGMLAPRIVSDFTFDKDALFARLTLPDDEYRLYLRIHAEMAPRLRAPDLVIWLQAGPATLMRRIAQRAIAMERAITSGQLLRLSEGYAAWFAREGAPPVLAVDADRVDFVARPDQIDRLVECMARFVGPRERFDGAA